MDLNVTIYLDAPEVAAAQPVVAESLAGTTGVAALVEPNKDYEAQRTGNMGEDFFSYRLTVKVSSQTEMEIPDFTAVVNTLLAAVRAKGWNAIATGDHDDELSANIL